MNTKSLNYIIIIILLICSLTLLLSLFTPIEITDSNIAKVIWSVSITGLLCLIAHIILRKKYKNIYRIFTFIAILSVGIYFLKADMAVDWETEKVLYVHHKTKNKVIAKQYQYIGEWTFNERIVKVTKVAPFLAYVEEVELANIDTNKYTTCSSGFVTASDK